MPDPFCTKELFSKTIFYESKYFMVLYDIKPVVPGHTLIVPKRHILDFLELNTEESADLHEVFDHVIPKILSIYGANENSYDMTSQIGPYSGRTVAHLHIHIVPRVKNDEYQSESSNVYLDIKMNKTHFTMKDVSTEVAKLRKEFGYK